MTVQEVADLLRVSPRAIRLWCRDGKIPFTKVGAPKGTGKVLFKREDVDALIEASTYIPEGWDD